MLLRGHTKPAQITFYVITATITILILGRYLLVNKEWNVRSSTVANVFSGVGIGGGGSSSSKDGGGGGAGGGGGTWIAKDVKSRMVVSEQIWEKTIRQRRELREALERDNIDPGFFPAQNYETYTAYPYSIWDFIPASYNCPHEVERIGRMGDGGKWVCGMSVYSSKKRPCILYSFGIQNESSFEQEMLERTNCEIFGYDFSVSHFGQAISAEMMGRAHFTQAGISGKTDEESSPPFYTIQDLMLRNGHTYIDILKIDIETAEFEALSSLNNWAGGTGVEFPIGQILIELHLFRHAPMTFNGFLNWWELVFEGRGWRPFWTEPNLLGVTLGLDDKNPRLAEYSLINVHDKKNVLYN